MKVMTIQSLDGLRSLSPEQRVSRSRVRVEEQYQRLLSAHDQGDIQPDKFEAFQVRFRALSNDLNRAISDGLSLDQLESQVGKFTRDVRLCLMGWGWKVLVVGGVIATAVVGFNYFKK